MENTNPSYNNNKIHLTRYCPPHQIKAQIFSFAVWEKKTPNLSNYSCFAIAVARVPRETQSQLPSTCYAPINKMIILLKNMLT